MATTLNIYDISNYAAGTTYSLDEIVKYATDGKFYYSLLDGNVGNTPSVTSTKWGGWGTNSAGTTKPYFFWKPSYGTPIQQTPRTAYLEMGGGYVQRVKRDINNTLLNFNIRFADITLNKAAAIAHFLKEREGVESFLFCPPPPYAKVKTFISKVWTVNDTFYNNHLIYAEFTEVSV